MPNWKKVIVSGSDASLNSLSVGNTSVTGSLNVYKSGSTVFSVQGSQGTLFEITDSLSGSLFSVSDISGIPILEVFSNDTVKIGTFGNEAIIVNGTTAIISGSLTGSLNLDSVKNAGTDTDKFLVLDTNGNVDFRTGAEILSDISAASSSIKNYVNFNNVVDFKTLTQGYAPMSGITDVQEGDTSPFANWLAPSDGYIERIELMVGETNTVSSSFSIRGYKNGSTLGVAQSASQGAARTVTEYVYGPTFSFSKRDRLAFFMDKTTNTSDLYTFNIYFQVGN